MPLLMIVCPKKRRSFPTNKVVRAEELGRTDLGTNTIGPCPYCGEQHTWTMRDAFPRGGRPRRQTRSRS